jgi:pimeloyl-ACP methyl ester carboxylesterase
MGNVTMEMYVKELGNKRIQIADYPGEKGPIIAIHGLTGNHKQMHYYAEMLKDEYRVISIDLRGRGNSSRADVQSSLFKHAEDVIELIQELKINNPILIGYSMGAFISSVVASKLTSVKALILLDGAANCSQQQRDIVQPSLGRLSKEYDSQESYIAEIKEIYSRLGIKWTDHLQRVAEYEVHEVDGHWENKSTEDSVLRDFDSFYSFVPKEVCRLISCKTLLVYARGKIGDFPPLFYEEAYDDTKKYTPDIETIVSTCNHYTMVFENRAEINKEIKSFLKRI